MNITNFDNTGLYEVENWLKDNIEKNININTIKEILKTVNISFVSEEINRLQSTLLCELKDSYVQQSQRYVTMGEDSYELPKLDSSDMEKSKKLMDSLFSLYSKMSELNEGDFKGRPKIENYKFGIPIEDARYILPLSTKTNLFCAMTGDKLFELYNLLQKKKYSAIFLEFKEILDEYIPKQLLKLISRYSDENYVAEDIVESYYKNQLNKINSKDNMILLDSFEDLDLKVGLGALTSTQKRTPSQTIEKWGDQAINKAKGVAKRVLGYGHDSIAEQARTTFAMMCSMVTYHQQIRHRLSKNFREPLENLVLIKDRKVIVPPTIENSEFAEEYLNIINNIKEFRIYVYEKYGLDKALYFLLNADQIKLIMSTNARIDIQMLSERICYNAQWEIRELSTKKLMILRQLSDTLYESALPSCVTSKCKEGKLSCGRQEEAKKKFL